MNLAFFHDSRLKKYKNKYYTSGGLTNSYLQKYLEYFSSIVLCTREEELEDNEKINKLSISSGELITFNGIKKLNVISLLFGKDREKIKENIKNSDFIIIRMPSVIGLIACYLINKSEKIYSIEVVGCAFDSLWNYGNIVSKVVAPIMYLLNKYYIKKAENVIYVSNEFLQKRYPNNHNNIGCSDVNIGNTDEKVLKKRLQKIEKKNKSEIYKLGLIGSLNVGYKGHETAIKAMKVLSDKVNLELHFLGAGDTEKWIKLAKKYKVEEKIFFDGVLPAGEAVYQWIDNLDIFIIPSLTEGLPRALVEAMSRACPTIGSDVGGIPELIGKDSIFHRKNQKQLANKILELTTDKNKMLNLAKINFDKSIEFESEKLYNKRNKFYKDIIEVNNDRKTK